MASIVWADVTAHASTLSTVPLAQQADLLCLANNFLNVAMFGGEGACKTKLARIYLVAHFATLPGAGGGGGGGGSAGPVISESTGGVSRTYADIVSSGSGSSIFKETLWGRRYLDLVRTSRARWPVVA